MGNWQYALAIGPCWWYLVMSMIPDFYQHSASALHSCLFFPLLVVDCNFCISFKKCHLTQASFQQLTQHQTIIYLVRSAVCLITRWFPASQIEKLVNCVSHDFLTVWTNTISKLELFSRPCLGISRSVLSGSVAPWIFQYWPALSWSRDFT